MPRESSVVDQVRAPDSARLPRSGGSWDREDKEARATRGKKNKKAGKKLQAVGSSWDRDQDEARATRGKKEQAAGKKLQAGGGSWDREQDEARAARGKKEQASGKKLQAVGRSWDLEQEEQTPAARGIKGQQGKKLQAVGSSWDRDHGAARAARAKGGQRGEEWEIGQDRSASDYRGGEKLLARRNGMFDSMDEGVAQGWLSQRDRENPFRRDPLSMDAYRSIADPRTQQMMWKVSEKLNDYSKRHGGVLGLQSHMTYEQILQGMLVDDELLVPVRPLMIANYRKCATAHGWPVEDEKFGVRIYLTSKRVFILDADLHKVSTLDRRNLDDKNFWVVDRITCAIRTIDELFFYPLPLKNITGMTLDIHYETRVSAWLYGTRPYWAVCWFCVGLIAALIGTLEALIVWGTVDRALKGNSGQFVPVFVTEDDGLPSELNMSFSYEWSHAKYHGHFAAGLDLRQLLTLFVGFACCCCAPCAYFSHVSYTRSQFRPKMQQRRQILLGATDPITQEQKAYKLLLDHRYETSQIKEYVHLMQRFCPVLAGTVLQ